MDMILVMFSHSFMQKALVVGVIIALCSGLLGVNLVLKRYSMIGDGLSHVAFGVMAIASCMNLAPLALAIPVVLITAFFLLGITENSGIKGDSAIGLITSASLAIGVMASSLSGGVNVDLNSYMFGSVLSLNTIDTTLSIILGTAVVLFYVVFYPGIFAVTFDEGFARATGIKANLYRCIISVLTAITVVLGMRMMGTLLISALLVFPSVCAMNVADTYKGVVLLAAILSVVCTITGIVLSFVLGTPVGATIVCVNLISFLISKFVKR